MTNNWKRLLVIPIAGGLIGAGLISSLAFTNASPSSAPTAAAATAAKEAEVPDANEPAEAPGTPEAAEANEPNLPGGGHADATGADVDHQYEGVE
jgi:hypothetical protein